MFVLFSNTDGVVVAMREVVDAESIKPLGQALREKIGAEHAHQVNEFGALVAQAWLNQGVSFKVSQIKAISKGHDQPAQGAQRLYSGIVVGSGMFKLLRQAEDILHALQHPTVECGKCHGTGIYEFGWDGQKFTRQGTCFDCAGKGQMTPADHKRDEYYHDHAAAAAIRADMAM